MAKSRRFQVVLTGTIPKGMTLAQARHAVWNNALNFDGMNTKTVDVDVDDYFLDGRSRRPMKMRLGSASMIRKG